MFFEFLTAAGIFFADKSCPPLREDINLWTHRFLKSSQVWNAEIFGENVTIALIGTGMDLEHFQTRDRIFTNFSEDPTNGVDDDQNGYVDDHRGWNFLNNNNQVQTGTGKATEMTGTIVSNHCAGPIRGIVPYTQIIPLQAFENDGLQQDLNQRNKMIFEAMDYGTMMGAQIILFESYAGFDSVEWKEKIQQLQKQNVFVVMPAADQSAEDISSLNFENLVVVGATNEKDQYASFSNYGSAIDLSAPGENVWTTIGMENNDPIAKRSHSGLAAAHAAAGVAALISAEPEIKVDQIKSRLYQGTDEGNFPVKSKGRLNFKKLLGL